VQTWSFDISRQADWDTWSWVCLVAALVLLSYAVRTFGWRGRRSLLSLLLIGTGVGGTIAVLAYPGLRTARIGLVWSFVLLGLLSAAFYLRLLDRLTPARTTALLVLRILALAALVPMLFEPVLRYVRMPEPERPLLVLVDASGSMSFPDLPNGPTRLQSIWQSLQPQVGRLRQHFRPQLYAFSSEATLLDKVEDLAAVRADGGSTDIVSAVRQAVARTPRDDALVVVLSDGIDNTHPAPANELATLGRRIYTIAAGSETAESAAMANIAVADIRAEDLSVGHEAKVTAVIRSTALPNRVVDVKMAEIDAEGKPIGEVREAKLVLQPTPQGQQVTMSFTPTKPGVQKLAVWIDPAAGERSTVDNRQEFQALAIDPGIRVLYIEGRLRPEFRDLRRLLEGDPNIEAATLLRIQENRFVASGTVNRQKLPGRLPTGAEWRSFDVIVIGDIDASFLSQPSQAAIEQSVADGKSLLMIGGEKSFGPGGYSGSAIEKALPVVVGPLDSPQESARFIPRLTAEGAVHPAMEGLTPFFGIAATPPEKPLPPLNGNSIVARETGAAQVLLTHPGKLGPDGKPQIVLAVQRYGKGRSAALTVHSTYLWALPLYGMGQDSPYNRLWGQLIRWLAGTDVRGRQRGSGVDALLNRNVLQPDESVRVRAAVRDTHGDATSFAQVSLRLKRTDAPAPEEQLRSEQSFAMNPVEGQNGMYDLTIPPIGRGSYVATIAATKDGQALGQSEVKFTVVPPQGEMLKLAANHALLRRIAAETHASSYDLSRLPELVDELIRSESSSKPEQVAIRLGNFAHALTALSGRPANWPRRYDLPMQALIVLTLLTAEWVLRRRWQLA